ncbi:MAG: formylglycine-generating enzyme family protein [Nitrospinota bacterium]|nr:formylglycine-generating enzyme family protein [Nitrospinota bacterium]
MPNRLPIIFFLHAFLAAPYFVPCVSWGSEPSPNSLRKERQKTIAIHDHAMDFARMILIPAGNFRMGSTFRQIIKRWNQCLKIDKTCREWWFKDELPEHKVYLDNYWIDMFEVTNEDYTEFVLATGHRPALDDTCQTEKCKSGNLWEGSSFPENISKQPVVQVSWHDAETYCHWRGKRLPTEAEWEKAARGPNGNAFPWGNKRPKGRATFQRKWHGTFTMTNIGSYSNGKSIYGVYDMAGNVWEWVADWYDMKYYKSSTRRNPKGPAEGQFKIVRGGSWINHALSLHSTFRRWSRPEVRFNDTGFRCAKDATHETQAN